MFTMKFHTDNDAFATDDMVESARILREIADKLEWDGKDSGKVMDVNGNSIGEWSLTE